MVSSLLADALADPTAALNALHSDDIDAFPNVVADYFKAVFSSHDAFAEIPPLEAPERHKDREIVRFRAMVQDTSPSPEMYLARRRDGGWGGWGQSDDGMAMPINYADLRECTVFWSVSIPGESAWCSAVINDNDSLKNEEKYTPHHPHKFPIPGAPHNGVQIKVYTNDRSIDAFKSTELHTFVGILTSEPLHRDLEFDTPDLVPTLHVLFSQPVPATIISRVYPCTSTLLDTREELITWIANAALAGDRDAAEWVLLSSISRVQSRTPPILPLTLTLSRFPSPKDPNTCATPAIAHVLSQVFPLLTTLPLSLETLNNTSFTPESKNEDLHSGWLQLPRGSVCLVTEGGVTEGKISESGISNLRAMQETMNAQTLEYVFPFSRFAFDSDVTFVVLAEGRKSALFQTDTVIPLQMAQTDFNLYEVPAKIPLPPQEKLDAFRKLVGAAKVGDISVGEETARFIQEDFVNERQSALSSEAPTSMELVQGMMVARLLALSMQESEISISVWKAAKSLEARRKDRLR